MQSEQNSSGDLDLKCKSFFLCLFLEGARKIRLPEKRDLKDNEDEVDARGDAGDFGARPSLRRRGRRRRRRRRRGSHALGKPQQAEVSRLALSDLDELWSDFISPKYPLI